MSRRCRASASLCSDRSLAVCTGTLGSASFTVSASASGSVSLPKIPGEPTLRVLVFFDPVGRIVARHRRQSVIEQHGDVGTAGASNREVGPAIPVKVRAHDAVRAVSCPGIHGNIEGALAVARRQEDLAVAVAGKSYCRGVVVGILVEVRTRNVGRGVFPSCSPLGRPAWASRSQPTGLRQDQCGRQRYQERCVPALHPLLLYRGDVLHRPASSNNDRILPDQGRRIPYMRDFCRYKRTAWAARGCGLRESLERCLRRRSVRVSGRVRGVSGTRARGSRLPRGGRGGRSGSGSPAA
jgi:hypothetical protein